MQETTLLEKKDLREQLAGRVEVLDKVKKLFLMPKLNMMTTQQVADYYEVPIGTVKRAFSENRDEIITDGAVMKTIKDFLKFDFRTLEQTRYKTAFLVANDITLEVPNRGIRCFSQRAILRIGMLLRDSPIAQEVRTQLLNTFEKTTDEQRVCDINEELEIQKQIGVAVMSGDVEKMNEAYAKAFAFKNRHIEELTENNKALAGEILKWNERACINKAVRIIASRCGTQFGYIWNDLYDELRYKHGIGLSQRGKPPYIQHVKEGEWPRVQQSLSAICENRGLSISKIIKAAKM